MLICSAEPAAEVVPAETTSSESSVAASTKTLEILKSVVYGGLIESLTSLSVVTSAASADATTCRIFYFHFIILISFLFKIILEDQCYFVYMELYFSFGVN